MFHRYTSGFGFASTLRIESKFLYYFTFSSRHLLEKSWFTTRFPNMVEGLDLPNTVDHFQYCSGILINSQQWNSERLVVWMQSAAILMLHTYQCNCRKATFFAIPFKMVLFGSAVCLRLTPLRSTSYSGLVSNTFSVLILPSVRPFLHAFSLLVSIVSPPLRWKINFMNNCLCWREIWNCMSILLPVWVEGAQRMVVRFHSLFCRSSLRCHIYIISTSLCSVPRASHDAMRRKARRHEAR